jgi:hypothetical protein
MYRIQEFSMLFAFIRNEYANSILVTLILTNANNAHATVYLIDMRHGGAELLGKSVRGKKNFNNM